jgi:SNF2-related domain/Restriction endonuclease/Helicase conserved C-terminal domain
VAPLVKEPIGSPKRPWRQSCSSVGLLLSRNADGHGNQVEVSLTDGYVTQLFDDGYLLETGDGYLLSWDALYEALHSPAYVELPALLAIPAQTQARLVLRSRNSLTDSTFSIFIDGWQDKGGVPFLPELVGPVMTHGNVVELMRPEQWRLFKAVVEFSRRSSEEHADLHHRQAWGRIRKLALEAQAHLDDFLHRSVVLTPEKLEIALRKSEYIADDSVIEIEPGFAGAPGAWLGQFDHFSDVRDRYDITTPEGIVQVLVSPKVRTVLEEIKRLPGRRVAGARAQAFILNPYATLGEDAKDVIVEAQFEHAREAAGLQYERFLPVLERDVSGRLVRVGLLVETAGTAGPTVSETHWLDDNDLVEFVFKLEVGISRNYQLISWHGYDLEVQGDISQHLNALKGAIEERRRPPVLVSYAEVHDLSAYSSRVESIGVEKAYYSPYIARKKDDEGWFPENVLPVIVYQPDGEKEAVAIPANMEAIADLQLAAQRARAEGKVQVEVSWLPKPMPLEEAEDIGRTFEHAFEDIRRGAFDPGMQEVARKDPLGTKKHLILRANIQSLDYEERRREALQAVPNKPDIPRSLRPEYSLMPHQCSGLAWMQHLYRAQQEYTVRGAVLADDMGLGKTFQLLALMAWLIERDVDVEPMLVVAPLSLLENWKEEADKFFLPGTLPILTAYGDALLPLRVPRASIDQRLRTEDGLVKFLKPDWIGKAKVVLTTYETLRDLEFSFASQRWSVMVCDEAQRIKNPAAMVTRAAKKQNVRFKIACTGTPVENTLADLWCLFDFIQPGLLGALNDFGQRYRKPIEAKNEEERARVEELRMRIAPQILRRTKAEVEIDFPKKVIVEECRKLLLSTTQRILYAKAIEDFKRRNEHNVRSPFKNHLGLLQYLRLICTDPRRHGLSVFSPEPLLQYRENAPKLNWLLTQLECIKNQSEKAIVFCEFRNIQRLLQHYIEEVFRYRPDIINGDASASANHIASRQKRIKAFQAQPGFGVIILSPMTAGFGVNIQAANHVIHYTRTWNPAKEDQATDRAYRIGQKKDVYVYYPVVCAEDFSTFDVKLDELLNRKRVLAGDMLNGSGDIGPSDFEITEVVPEGEHAGLDERVTLDMVLRMDWQYFECLANVLWTKLGYRCYQTPSSSDNGVDFVALRDDEGELVQTKTSGIGGVHLGWDAVKEVVAGAAFYQRRHPGVAFAKVCLTNQFFNEEAHENAGLNSVVLLDQSHLTDMLERLTVTMLEVERLRYAEWPDEANVVDT